MNNTQTLPLKQNIKLRPLISYALSSYSMAHGEDSFKALIPLFAPIIAANPNKLFEPRSFCNDLQKSYGLNISEHVAKNFIDPMVHAGLLEKTTNAQRHAVYRYASKHLKTLDTVS